jgi:hypothetical protein
LERTRETRRKLLELQPAILHIPAQFTTPRRTAKDFLLRPNNFSGWPAVSLFLAMRPLAFAAAVLSFASTALCSENSNLTTPLTSRVLLPATFKPPQNFKNANLVHIINLEKSYPKEAINVLIENVAKSPQDEYFVPFTSAQMAKIGGLEVKDRKDPEAGLFEVDAVDFDVERYDVVIVSEGGRTN